MDHEKDCGMVELEETAAEAISAAVSSGRAETIKASLPSCQPAIAHVQAGLCWPLLLLGLSNKKQPARHMGLNSSTTDRLSIKVGLRTRQRLELRTASMLTEGPPAGAGTQRCFRVLLCLMAKQQGQALTRSIQGPHTLDLDCRPLPWSCPTTWAAQPPVTCPTAGQGPASS